MECIANICPPGNQGGGRQKGGGAAALAGFSVGVARAIKKATSATTALGRAICQARVKVFSPPAASMTASAPRPEVSLFTTSCGSSNEGLIHTSAA